MRFSSTFESSVASSLDVEDSFSAESLAMDETCVKSTTFLSTSVSDDGASSNALLLPFRAFSSNWIVASIVSCCFSQEIPNYI